MLLRLALLRRLDDLDAANAPYDRVVLTRPDHYYACPHPNLTVSGVEVHIPEGQDYDGVNDRHAVFAFASRARVLAMLPWMAAHDTPITYSFEAALKAYFRSEHLAVRRFRRVMALLVNVSAPGGGIRWHRHGPIPPEPLPDACNETTTWLKYPLEYVPMAGSCGLSLEGCKERSQMGSFLAYCGRTLRNRTGKIIYCGMAWAQRASTGRNGGAIWEAGVAVADPPAQKARARSERGSRARRGHVGRRDRAGRSAARPSTRSMGKAGGAPRSRGRDALTATRASAASARRAQT